MSKFKLMKGDCLKRLKEIPDKSVDLVLCDPPYGTTACKWDNIIPFEPMWFELNRICKESAAIAIFGAEPFSSMLRCSNIKFFKYDWVWEKSHATGFLNAWKQPMRNTENISIFYRKQCNYIPIIEDKKKENIRPVTNRTKLSDNYGSFDLTKHKLPADKSMPKTILKFNKDQGRLHPTQKPILLLEYLIKTYTLENETILDFTMGSGSTGVACKNLKRNFIGIEKDDKYFKIAVDRIKNQNTQNGKKERITALI